MSEPITEAEAFAVMQVMIDRIAELEALHAALLRSSELIHEGEFVRD